MKLKLRRTISVRMTTILLAFTFVTAAQTSAHGAAPSPANLDEHYAVEVRTEFGLRSDLDYIRAVATGEHNDDDLGTPLSVDEHQEMTRRHTLGDKVPLIDDAFAKTSSYAGAWMDQPSGGVLRVLFTQPPSPELQNDLDRLLDPGQVAAVSIVGNSLSQLETLAIRIQEDAKKDPNGFQVLLTGSGLDLSQNKVAISITKNAPAGTESSILAKYGSSVSSVTRTDTPTAASARDIRSGRLYSGEWMTQSNAQGSSCSIGYADAKSAYNETYAVTAGHCGPVGTTFVQGLGGSRYMGTVHVNGTIGYTYTNCDCAAVGPTPVGGYGTNAALINGNALRVLASTGSAYSGEGPICQNGAKSYDTQGHIWCGYVTNVGFTTYNISGDYGSYSLLDSIQTNIHTMHGDSGSILIDGTQLVGFMSGGSGLVNQDSIGNNAFFSKATNISTAGLSLSYAT